MNNITEKNKNPQQSSVPEKKPNENAGFQFSSHIKIFDPNTKEVLVQKRGDN